MPTPPRLAPFVLDIEPREPERQGPIDLYRPDRADRPSPAILFVHGMAQPGETPSQWPVFRGYGALTAGAGLIGAVVDHGLDGPAAFPTAAATVAGAVETVRADPRVDPDRVALWFFSSGGLLLA